MRPIKYLMLNTDNTYLSNTAEHTLLYKQYDHKQTSTYIRLMLTYGVFPHPTSILHVSLKDMDCTVVMKVIHPHWIEHIVDVPFRLSTAAARRLMPSRYTSRLKSPAASGILHHATT